MMSDRRFKRTSEAIRQSNSYDYDNNDDNKPSEQNNVGDVSESQSQTNSSKKYSKPRRYGHNTVIPVQNGLVRAYGENYQRPAFMSPVKTINKSYLDSEYAVNTSFTPPKPTGDKGVFNTNSNSLYDSMKRIFSNASLSVDSDSDTSTSTNTGTNTNTNTGVDKSGLRRVNASKVRVVTPEFAPSASPSDQLQQREEDDGRGGDFDEQLTVTDVDEGTMETNADKSVYLLHPPASVSQQTDTANSSPHKRSNASSKANTSTSASVECAIM